MQYIVGEGVTFPDGFGDGEHVSGVVIGRQGNVTVGSVAATGRLRASYQVDFTRPLASVSVRWLPTASRYGPPRCPGR